jgi:hypothetical protein
VAGVGLSRNSGFPGFLTLRVSLPSPWTRTPARCCARMPGGARPGPWNPARRPCRGVSKRVAPSCRCGTVVTRSAQVSLVTGDCLRRQRRASYGSQPSYELQRLARDEGDAVGNRHALRGACCLPRCACASCTDGAVHRTGGTRRAGIMRRPGPRTDAAMRCVQDHRASAARGRSDRDREAVPGLHGQVSPGRMLARLTRPHIWLTLITESTQLASGSRARSRPRCGFAAQFPSPCGHGREPGASKIGAAAAGHHGRGASTGLGRRPQRRRGADPYSGRRVAGQEGPVCRHEHAAKFRK